MIRVLHVLSGLYVGGAEMMLVKLLEGMGPRAVDSEVVALQGPGPMGPKIRATGVQVGQLMPLDTIAPVGALLGLRKAVQRYRPDVVHGWMYHGNLAATCCKVLADRGTRVAWNIRHSLDDLPNESKGTQALVHAGSVASRFADAIVFNSQTALRQHTAAGFRGKSSVVIENGFDARRFRPSSKVRAAVRRRLGFSPESLVFGHVGRFHPLKGQACFLKAAAILARSSENVRFLMVGRGVEPGNEPLRALIRGPLLGRVVMLGEQDDVAGLMNAMDVFSLTSVSESFPNVLGEGMLCGLPCVATDVGDSREVLGDAGILVPRRRPPELAGAWMRLVGATRAERVALGRRARERVIRNFGLPRIVDAYVRLYERLVRERH